MEPANDKYFYLRLHKKGCIITSLAIIVVANILFINYCFLDNYQPNELSRLTSPDGKVDAVMVRSENGGATVGFYYSIYLVPKGNELARWPHSRGPVFTTAAAAGLEMEWGTSKLLEISYKHAEIEEFINSWHHPRNFNHRVEILLVKNNN